jgi:hypothetical protein
MRFILAICFVCMIGAPAALAASGSSSERAGSMAKPLKHKVESARHKVSRVPRDRGLGGIHPLVGSGDY